MLKNNEPIKVGKEMVLWKMTNMLRATARMGIDDPTLTQEQKKEQMKTIEQLLNFIKDFDTNIEILDMVRQKPLTTEQMNRIEKEDMGYGDR